MLIVGRGWHRRRARRSSPPRGPKGPGHRQALLALYEKLRASQGEWVRPNSPGAVPGLQHEPQPGGSRGHRGRPRRRDRPVRGMRQDSRAEPQGVSPSLIAPLTIVFVRHGVTDMTVTREFSGGSEAGPASTRQDAFKPHGPPMPFTPSAVGLGYIRPWYHACWRLP